VLNRLSVPTRVVRGSRDQVVSQRWAEEVARIAGAPTPAVVPGWGHAVNYDAPSQVADAVLELAGTVAAANSSVRN